MTEPRDDADDQNDENLDDEDTPAEADAEDQDTPDDAEQPADTETRLKEAQKLIARQGQELGVWRRGDTPPDAERGRQAAAEPGEGDGAPDNSAYVAGLEQDSWRAAEAIYGQAAIEAYTAVFPLWDVAQTPADHIAAFEAYHELRTNGGTPEDAAAGAAGEGKKRTRADALQPRVDLNQSDAGPDLNADKKVAEARKSGKLEDFVKASREAMGF